MNRQSKLLAIITLIFIVMSSDVSFAGLKKWFNQEVMSTVRGQRPIKIDPSRITITIKGRKFFEVSGDTAYISVGGVTAKTHQLRKRLEQAACIYATEGNVMACAPDIINREMRNLIEQAAEEEDVAIQTKEQKMMSDIRCAAAIAGAKRNDKIFADLHKNSIATISSNKGWQIIKLNAQATRVKVTAKNWTTGSDSNRLFEDYPADSLLVSVKDLGITSIMRADVDGYFVFPVTVQSLEMRINDNELSDNHGTISVKFDYKSDDISFICF